MEVVAVNSTVRDAAATDRVPALLGRARFSRALLPTAAVRDTVQG